MPTPASYQINTLIDATQLFRTRLLSIMRVMMNVRIVRINVATGYIQNSETITKCAFRFPSLLPEDSNRTRPELKIV